MLQVVLLAICNHACRNLATVNPAVSTINKMGRQRGKKRALKFKDYVGKRHKADESLAFCLKEDSKDSEEVPQEALSSPSAPVPEIDAFVEADEPYLWPNMATSDDSCAQSVRSEPGLDFENPLSDISEAVPQDDILLLSDGGGQSLEQGQDESSEAAPHGCGMDSFVDFVIQLQSRKHVSKDFCRQILAYMCSNGALIAEDLASGWKKSFDSCYSKAISGTPKVHIDIKTSTQDGRDVHMKRVSKFPKKKIELRDLQVDYTLFYVSLKDVVTFHQQCHPMGTNDKIIDIAIDGVPETKSGGVSIDVFSLSFVGCKTVYPLAILRPSRSGMSLSESIIFEPFLRELSSCGLSVRLTVCDAPMRAKVLGMVGHSGKMPCQYCYAKATTKGSHKFFPPASNSNCKLRTNRGLRRAAKALQRVNQKQTGMRRRVTPSMSGVKKVSVLSAIRDIDLIHQVPAERMHLCDLGIVRKMARLSFEGKVKYKMPYKPSNMKHLNRLLQRVRTPCECSRRARPMHLGYWKSEEWRNLYLFMFPCVLQVVRPEQQEVWKLTVYIMRALMLPDELYRSIEHTMPPLVRKWYFSFKDAYGEYACSYNVHTFLHVLEVRKHGPLTASSAVKFESLYGFLKECFAAGTCSTGKQALQAAYIKQTDRHACTRSLTINGKTTSKRDDSIVYTKTGLLLKVDKSTRNNATIRGTKLSTKKGYFLLPGLDFNDVLVFEVEDETEAAANSKKYIVRHEDISGKGALVLGVVSILTTNMLTEL